MSEHSHGIHAFNEKARKEIRFSDQALATIKSLMGRFPEGKTKAALLPVLHVAQAESDGWLSAEVMDYVAELMGIQAIEVFEVASFYSMYNLNPVGKCVLDVCHTSSCWTRGADDLIDYIGKKLNIRPGETTADGQFTLKTVECLGSCGSAPMLQVGAEYHENLTNEKVDVLLEKLRSSGRRYSYTDLEYQNSK
jgi:NADH-quinone oxidoreductase subunit E